MWNECNRYKGAKKMIIILQMLILVHREMKYGGVNKVLLKGIV